MPISDRRHFSLRRERVCSKKDIRTCMYAQEGLCIRCVSIRTCMYVCVYVCVYIYIYIHLQEGDAAFLFGNTNNRTIICLLFGLGLS